MLYLTYNKYKNWDRELIFGFAFSLLPALNGMHQATIIKFSTLISTFFDTQNFGGEIYNSLDWIFNNHTVVRPDSMIVDKKATTDFLTFTPI